MFRSLLFFVAMLATSAAFALDPALVKGLTGDNDAKIAAITAIAATGDPDALALLKSMADGELKVDGEEVVLNNRVRRELEGAISALRLVSPDRDVRLAAARGLAGGADEAMLPLVKKALSKEADPEIKGLLESTAASMELKAGDKATRIAAIKMLATSSNPNTKTLLLPLLEDADTDVKREAQASLTLIEGPPRLVRAAPASSSPESAWARSCSSPRSASRSPTGSWASSTWRTASSS
jgi:urea transport system permease protein